MWSRLVAIGAAILLVGACDSGGGARSTSVTETEIPTATGSTLVAPLTTATVAASTTTTSTTKAAVVTTAAPTTTSPVDTVPPLLEVTAPEEGATSMSRAVRFEGTTEPGASVVAWGRWAADVAADGSWHLVLILNPGTNIAQFTATDAAGNTTTVRTVVRYTPPTTTTQSGSVTKTVVITFMPSVVPEEHLTGQCYGTSNFTDRPGVYRCMTEDAEILDPCFDTGQVVVCEPSPPTGDPGIVLDLVAPLPEQPTTMGGPRPWIIELFDGAICRAHGGATTEFEGVRITYGCTDGSWVLDDVRSGDVWTGHRITLGPEGPPREVADDLGFVPIRTVWQ